MCITHDVYVLCVGLHSCVFVLIVFSKANHKIRGIANKDQAQTEERLIQRQTEKEKHRQSLWLGRSLHLQTPTPLCPNHRKILWKNHNFIFQTHPNTHTISAKRVRASTFTNKVFPWSLPQIQKLSSSPCLSVLLLSPQHAWWFDIANWCQTTKPYFPSAVLSVSFFSLSLHLSTPHPSLLLQFNLWRGLSCTDFSHDFLSPCQRICCLFNTYFV